MNLHEIELQFSNDIRGLAGYNYGFNIYKVFIESSVNEYPSLKIIFPKNIERVSSSFAEGMFNDIIDKFGYSSIGSKFQVEFMSDELHGFDVTKLL